MPGEAELSFDGAPFVGTTSDVNNATTGAIIPAGTLSAILRADSTNPAASFRLTSVAAQFTTTAAVPEPSSMVALSLCAMGLVVRRRR